jgi:hypothetical protein
MKAVLQYKAVVEERLHKDCDSIVKLIQEIVLPRLTNDISRRLTPGLVEEVAFFWKMVGDYYRYASEASSSKAAREQRLPIYKKGALNAYTKAMDLCRGKPSLKPYNSVVLGLALNFSVFHYEVMGDPIGAC